MTNEEIEQKDRRRLDYALACYQRHVAHTCHEDIAMIIAAWAAADFGGWARTTMINLPPARPLPGTG